MPLSYTRVDDIRLGFGNILDSAVKKAVTHLARSLIDFLYDDEEPPQYDYHYQEDINNINYSSLPSPAWSKHFPLKRRIDFPPTPASVTPSRVSTISRVSTVTDPVFPYMPFLLLLSLIAVVTSYYLIVQNGPTPVVKEREAVEYCK